jgi:histidine ammonia-lyase
VDAADDLDAGAIVAVAAGRPVLIGAALAREVDERCAAVRRALADGQPVYGVNTGMGALSGVRLSEADQAVHQRNLMLARAVGGPPWLPASDVRALLAVRLRTFLSGDAGVSAALCQRLADFLAAGLAPAVPALAAGSAGEIAQLAHAFGPLVGLGHVLAPDGTVPDRTVPDRTVPATVALAEHGLAEFALGPKEGIALLAGVPGATALSLLAVAEAATVLRLMAAAAGLSIAAIGAPGDPYAAACARGDEVLGQELARLRAYLGQPPEQGAQAEQGAQPGLAEQRAMAGQPGRPPRMLQAPVSFRVAGPALAHVARAVAALAAAADRALAGVTDSPAFLEGSFLGTAGFHGIDLAGHCDQLTAAVAHAAEVGAARTHRLLDPRVTGLTAQLAARPGPDAGLVAVHKRAAGEVHAMRRLALPAALGTIETSTGQEDVQSFAWAAAVGLRTALRHARAAASCELLTAYQAATLGAAAGQLDAGPAARQDLLATLAGLIEPIESDRQFGADIERIAAAPWP